MKKSKLLEKYGSVFDEIKSMQFIPDNEKEAIIGRILSSEYIDLTIDYGFKFVFGQHLDLLKMLLEDILQIEIETLERIPDQVVGTFIQDKYIIMDVGVTLKDGRRIIVEMQNAKRDDLKNRLVYYGSALIYNQLKKGDDVYKYEDAYVLIFLNNNLNHSDPDDRRLVYRYRLQETESGECFGEQLSITVCELPNLVKGSKDNMSVIEQWFYYFRNMKKFSNLAGGPKVLDERYQPLIDASKTRRFTDKDWEKYIRAMYYTKEEIENIGKPYYEDGLRDGAYQSKIQIAKALLAKGIDSITVQECTGLTPEEVAGE